MDGKVKGDPRNAGRRAAWSCRQAHLIAEPQVTTSVARLTVPAVTISTALMNICLLLPGRYQAREVPGSSNDNDFL